MKGLIIRFFTATLAIALLVGVPCGSLAGSPPHYFGVVPDVTEPEVSGVRIEEIRPGSPAAEAGLQSGDVITELAQVAIQGLDDLIFALRSVLPGTPVRVIYYREGQWSETQAVLKARR